MRAPLVPVVLRFGLVLLGFAAATLAAALLHVPAARAQDAAPTTARRAATTSTDGATRPRPAQPDTETAYETAPRTPRLRGTEAELDSDADTDPSATGDGEDAAADGEAAPGESARSTASADGDLGATGDGVNAGDGIIDLSEPIAPDDGTDPTRDTRPAEDADVFDNPPAGHDPLLFQVEDIDPVETDRRPARLARFEPYDPIGIRVGSFVFFPEAEIAGLSTSNVLSSPDARSDIAAIIQTTSRLVSNWNVHALELRGTTLSSFHDDFASEDDRAWGVEARGRFDISRRTNVQAIAGHDVSQESRSAIDANQLGERAEVTVNSAELALNHRFNRLSVQLRGSVSDATYSDTNGNSNADRDTLSTAQAVRASWEFKPTFSVYAEQELNQRDKHATPADGIPRDSTGTRTRVGLDFGATGAVLRGTIGIGYGTQDPDDRRLKSVDTVLFDANLAWRPSEITSILLTGRSDIYETTTEDSGGVIAHTAGIEARHALRRYLIASAGLSYTHYDYDSTALAEREITSFAGLEYYASPELVLFARYQHLDFQSGDLDGDYKVDEVRVGARVRR